MTRYRYDIENVLEGAAEQSPFLIQLPAGGRQLVAALVSEAEWRSKFTYQGQDLNDEQWDEFSDIVAKIFRAIEDGENVDELSESIRYLADNLRISHSGSVGSVGDSCCMDDFVANADDVISGRSDDNYGPLVEALKQAVIDSFTDDGVAFPPEFADRAAYESAKCTIANQLYRDFRTTLLNLTVLDIAFIAASGVALASALFSSQGALVGMVAAGISLPIAAVTLVAIFGSLIVLGINVGNRLKSVGEELDKETFVCAMFEATNASAAKTAMLAEVQDAHDRAVASGAMTLSAAFEDGLLQIVAILMPSETLEALFSLAGAGIDFAVSTAEDYDCSLCGAEEYTEGQQLLTNSNFETDLSSWTQDPPSSWSWEASPHSIGRGRISSGAGGSMEQHFDVTQAMIDDGWDLRVQTQVRGSSTGSSVTLRLYDETDAIVLNKAATAGDTKTMSYNTINEVIPLTVGSWSVRVFVANDDVIEYVNVFTTKVP